MRRSVIDVGSNSVLLLVSELQAGAWVPIAETSEVTGLGEGTKTTGLLAEPGMTCTLDAIGRAYLVARSLDADSVIAAATMAARIAKNTSEFLRRAEAQGTPVTVLSGEDEAELGFLAVANDPHPFGDCISIIDVGGQSTELVTARREGPPGALASPWAVSFQRSFPVGTLGLRSGSLCDESPDGLALLRATREIDDLLNLDYEAGQAGTAIALGATGTNLVTIRGRMASWQPEKVHGAWLGYEEVSRAVGWMSPMTDAGRAAIVGIEKGRERTIHIGSLILERVLYAIRAEGCLVSVRGWRHALLERDPL